MRMRGMRGRERTRFLRFFEKKLSKKLFKQDFPVFKGFCVCFITAGASNFRFAQVSSLLRKPCPRPTKEKLSKKLLQTKPPFI